MKEKIASIRKVIDALEDNDVKKELTDTLNSVEQFIQTAETNQSKIEDLQAQLDDSNLKLSASLRDTMEYKDRMRKAEKHINERDETIKELEVKVKDIDTLTEQNENLKQLKVERDQKRREEYDKLVKDLQGRPNFSNFSDALVLPTEEMPLDKIDMDSIENSFSMINDWKKRGFVEFEDGGGNGKPAETPQGQPTKMDGIFDKVFGGK